VTVGCQDLKVGSQVTIYGGSLCRRFYDQELDFIILFTNATPGKFPPPSNFFIQANLVRNKRSQHASRENCERRY
jgi:hypothetical protein